MELLIYFLLVAGFIVPGSWSEVCYFCLPTSSFSSCQAITQDCGFNNGCYSYTYISSSNVRMYQKGCQTQDSINCNVLSDLFCTPDVAAVNCCSGDLCNSGNPLTEWRPFQATNLQYAEIYSRNATLTWESRCDDVYTFEVGYILESIPDQSPVIIQGIQETSVVLTNLEPNSLYFIFLSTVYNEVTSFNVASIFTTNLLDATEAPPSDYIFCAEAFDVPFLNHGNDIFQTCQLEEQSCFTIIYQLPFTDQSFVSRGCTTTQACTELTLLNRENCKPGGNDSMCSSCCSRGGCNVDDQASNALFSDCSEVSLEDRSQCGESGVDRSTCVNLGCCYDQSGPNVGLWCFHKQYNGFLPTESPPTTSSSPLVAGLELWIIIVIAVAIFLILVIIVIAVFCAVKRRRNKRKGFYDCDAVYATPHKGRTRNVATVSARENLGVVLEETP